MGDNDQCETPQFKFERLRLELEAANTASRLATDELKEYFDRKRIVSEKRDAIAKELRTFLRDFLKTVDGFSPAMDFKTPPPSKKSFTGRADRDNTDEDFDL